MKKSMTPIVFYRELDVVGYDQWDSFPYLFKASVSLEG